jgi:hypothetical protein
MILSSAASSEKKSEDEQTKNNSSVVSYVLDLAMDDCEDEINLRLHFYYFWLVFSTFTAQNQLVN